MLFCIVARMSEKEKKKLLQTLAPDLQQMIISRFYNILWM